MSDNQEELNVDISPEQVAVVCMLVSNPGGGERPHAWQKRVNDILRAQRDLIKQLREAIEINANMLETHAPDCFPEVNEHGQKHFVRVLMESAAESLREALEPKL